MSQASTSNAGANDVAMSPGSGPSASQSPPMAEAAAAKGNGETSAAAAKRAADGSPPPPAGQRRKRTRPVSACEACRAHKVKCILKPDQPICERCAAAGKECLFRIDDLRPDFRAERFGHLGPPGADAREIKSKPKAKRKDSSTSGGVPLHRRSMTAQSREDGDEGDESSSKKRQRKDSSSAAASTSAAGRESTNGNGEGGSQPPLRAPGHSAYLAAPAPAPVAGPSSPPPPPPPHHAAPYPPGYAYASHRPPFASPALPPPPPPPHHHHAAPGYVMGGPSSFHPPTHYGHDGYPQPQARPSAHAVPTYYSAQPPVMYGSPHAAAMPYHAPSPRPSPIAPQSPQDRDRLHRPRLPSAANSPSSSSPLPPIRTAFPGLGSESSATSDRRATGFRYGGDWDRPSTSASDTRSERPFSPLSKVKPPPLTSPSGSSAHLERLAPPPPLAPHHERKESDRSQTESQQQQQQQQRVTFHSPPAPADHPSVGETHTVGSQGSRGSVTKKPSLVVPFFRWFGLTANTPGYRRIKVAVNPDLPEDEDERPPTGIDQEADGQEQKKDEAGATASAAESGNDATAATASTPALPNGSPKQGQTDTPSTVPGPSSTPKLPGMGSRHLLAMEQDSVASSTSRDLFDPSRPRYPRKDLLLHLSELFVKYFRTHLCPWIIEEELLSSVKDGTMPSILANSICAMTARFSEWAELKRKPPKSVGECFSEMAKTLIVPMLSWPSLDVIEALIILSYAEFGAGSDSGLWMYSGMGMRMAMDLGIEHESTILSLPTQAQQDKARWLFWSGCYAIDRITCFGTGRPVTLLDDAIDCRPPVVEPTADTFYASQIIQVLLRRGRMGELLNRRPVGDEMRLSEKKVKLTELWQECAAYFQSLPSSCAFGVQSFKRAAANNQGSAFLYLHVLFQSTISLLERPGMMRARGDADYSAPPPAPSSGATSAAGHISASASRSIVDMIALAAHVDPKSFHSSPYLDQLILPTGRLFVAEREAINEAMRQCGYWPGQSRQSSPQRQLHTGTSATDSTAGGGAAAPSTATAGTETSTASNDRVSHLLRHRKVVNDNLTKCSTWLSTLSHFWAGASWPARALEQEAAGASSSDVIPDADDEDAMQAPLRDMELLSAWARDKLKQAKVRMASRRGSAVAAEGGAEGQGQKTSRIMTISTGSGASSMASPGAATSIANLLAAANAAQQQQQYQAQAQQQQQQHRHAHQQSHDGAALESTSGSTSGGSASDNPLGLALSGQLSTSAEIDIRALVDMWAAEQERVHAQGVGINSNGNGGGQGGGSGAASNGASTPYGKMWTSAATPGPFDGLQPPSQAQQHHQPSYAQHATHPSYSSGSSAPLVPHQQQHQQGFQTPSQTQGGPAPPMMDFSALQLEELLSADLSSTLGGNESVFPLLPLDLSSFDDFIGGGSGAGAGAGGQGTGTGATPSAGADVGAGQHESQQPAAGGALGGGYMGVDGGGASSNAGSGGGFLPHGISSALFGFH